MKNQNTEVHYTPIQLKFPLGFEKIINIDNPVYTFSEIMAHIDLQKYIVKKGHEMGRPRYEREKLLKIVLFAFMEFGYSSLRFIKKLCETDIRFLWMLDGDGAPSHMTIDNFINDDLKFSLDEVFNDINSYMFRKLHTDLKPGRANQ